MSRTQVEHVFFDSLPDVQDLPAAEGTNGVNALNEDTVLEPVPDGSEVVNTDTVSALCDYFKSEPGELLKKV